jgi:NTP pyrophosphatase (non-canonical NTP hydrolase)
MTFDTTRTALACKAIDVLVEQSHRTAVDKGWWESDRSFGEQIALMHSELSEALEEWRNHRGLSEVYTLSTPAGNKPEGIAAEFADVLIRLFDTCGRYEIPLADALLAKMQYNDNREYRHGGKKA